LGEGLRSAPIVLLMLGGALAVGAARADPLDVEPAGVAAWSAAPSAAGTAIDRDREWHEWYRARVQWRRGVRELGLERARNRRLALLLRRRGAASPGVLWRQRLNAGSRRLSGESEGAWVTEGAGTGRGGRARAARGQGRRVRAATDAEVPIELLRRRSSRTAQ